MSAEHDANELQLTGAWRRDRAYLVNLAFRMMGDIGEAEDIVQEAFSRLLKADRDAIDDQRGWLIVVTSRLCLDQMRSARSRRERYEDANDLDRAAEQQRSAVADPADRVTLDDSVRLALLVLLEQLSPAERVVFVLHDMFQIPFTEISETVGRSPATCRQLARRARQRIQDGSSIARFDIDPHEHRLVTEKFIAACTGGDLTALLEVLDADVVGQVDQRPRRVVGAPQVARNLLRYWGDATLVSQPINGEAGVLAFLDRQLAGVLVLSTDADRINHIHVIVDPAKLAFLTEQLAPSA